MTGSSINGVCKIAAALWAISLGSGPPAGYADAIGTAEAVYRLAEETKLTINKFMRESFEQRMRYEFKGQFQNQEDKETLHKLAKAAGNHLGGIIDNQRRLKEKIEDYEGDDWDEKYGLTGLWRTLSADFYTTTLNKCEVDFYLALACPTSERKKVVRNIRAQLDSADQIYDGAYSQFLRAKIFAFLARADPTQKTPAKEAFSAIRNRYDVGQATLLRMEIENLKLLGSTTPDQLRAIGKSICRSKCDNDLELVLSLAFLARNLDQPEAFKSIVSLFPQIESFLGQMILSHLSTEVKSGRPTNSQLQNISVLDAELAIKAAWAGDTGDHKELLDRFCDIERFQIPLILYVAAVNSVESSPAKSVELLVEASRLQELEKSDRLGIDAETIATEAAELAYNLFVAGSIGCESALEAFESLRERTPGGISEKCQYLYSAVLSSCGQAERSKKFLQAIAAEPAGPWRNRARLDLILQATAQPATERQSRRSELLKQLNDLLGDIEKDESQIHIRTEAISTYCQLLLESNDEASAEQVMETLCEAENIGVRGLGVFKAKALQDLGRLNESIECMLLAVEPNNCEDAGEVVELLSEIIAGIDELEIRETGFEGMMRDCKKLARACYYCLENLQAGLLLAEISLFNNPNGPEELSAIEKLLSNIAIDNPDGKVDLLRCRARLLTEQKEFERGAKLWAQVAETQKSQPLSADKPTWRWWRAKFYELYCWSERLNAEKDKVVHTIEVLESSFNDIPSLWAEKLRLLKQQCGDKGDS